MEASEARAYINRWQAVAEIERKILRKTSPAENWEYLNAIKARAARLDIKREDDEGEMEIFLLWARLKTEYASN